MHVGEGEQGSGGASSVGDAPKQEQRPVSDPTTYDPPRPIRGWSIQATCPGCGGVLEHAADGRPDGFTSRAKARCSGCGHEWLVEITIADVTSRVGRRRRLIGRQIP